jgi:hypothetical protein
MIKRVVILRSSITIILFLLTLSIHGQYLVSNNCGTDKKIEVKMKGIQGVSNPFIDVGSISLTTALIVNVWIDESDCSGTFPSTITITNGSQTFTPSGILVTQVTSIPEKIYRVTINNPTSNLVNISNLGTCYSTSVEVQKVMTNISSASYAQVIDREFHYNNATYVTNIGTATQTRTVRVSVPVHEKDNNGSIARVEVWGMGVTLLSKEITIQTQGNAAGLIEIDVPNIPTSVTQLNVKIISPSSTGASFGVGILTTSTTTACSIPCSTLVANAGADKVICPSTSTSITVAATGGTSPYTYAWSNTTYTSPNTNPTKVVSPTSNTTYLVTVTDAIGCTATDNILVSVVAKSTCSEICGNGIDDDLDGLIDCADSDCYLAANSGDTDNDNDGIGDFCDLDDDNDGITDEDEGCPTCSINGIFINGDFELNMTHNTFIQTNQANVPGWSTTATDKKIEIWKSGFSSNSPATPAQSGQFFAEINATQAAALYQRVCSKPGAKFSWSVWHRGRAGVDVAVVRIGNTLMGSPIQVNMSTGNTGWVKYSGVYTVPTNEVETYFIFEAVSTASGNSSSGNFIDNIQIVQTLEGTCLDTDGDNIPNYLDTDSDADGCPDAIEGSGTVLSTNIGSNLRILGSVSTKGIPIFINGGQGYGTSQNPAILSCPEVCNNNIDDDGDGFIDCDDPDCQVVAPATIIVD